ncbi:helix-turn-helix transcriptional regulator [Pararobbsia alpina]|uniref:HTH-type transcriptional regulator MalT n=1 Tax=Pararobbsia alpina TaxID=621374 RepID=A0A6S7BPM9_9BURK|nr:LuxR C-terminal-related transcriptional regulator [Pararobbsia alpina]CAB3798440.1 HTH-type transcriptional regulator MalT [Pararobbsia alpina]
MTPLQDALPFLKPKVTPPRRKLDVIGRERLMVDQMETRLLTVMRAPAGYGKTTLALAWVDALRERGARVAWLSLDPEDDDPLRFMHYVLHALAHALPPVAGTTAGLVIPDRMSPIGTTAHELLGIVLNGVLEYGDELYLFIDDFHHLASPETHALLISLLRHSPSNFHLVFISRTGLALPLTRLQTQGQLLEVDASELRFTTEETGRLLSAHQLPLYYAVPLQTLTDGWAAALRLAILASESAHLPQAPPPSHTSLAYHAPPAAHSVLSEPYPALFERITGLAHEMLEQLPAAEVIFLEQVAVAERLCAPLCEALTRTVGNQAMLETLEGRLLLTRLTEEGDWFSCHPLLRDVLMARLRAGNDAAITEQHRRASHWYAAQSYWSDAVRHALRAGDSAQAIRWIDHCAMGLVKRGDLLTLLDWETQLRSALIDSPRSLRLAITWAHVLGDACPANVLLLDAIEAQVQVRDHEKMRQRGLPVTPSSVTDAETPRSHEPPIAVEGTRIAWECKVARAIALAQDDRVTAAWQLASECLPAPDNDAWMINSVYNVLMFTHWRARRWPDFYATPNLPYRPDEHEGNIFSSIYRLTLRGGGELEQLQTGAARRHLIEAMQLGETHTGILSLPTTLPACLLANLEYERGELDLAAQLLEGRLPIIRMSGFGDAIRTAYRVCARIEFRQGRAENAYALLEQGESLARVLGLARLEIALLYEHERLLLQSNRLWEAQACVQRIALAADAVAAAVATPPDAPLTDAIGTLSRLSRAHLDLAEGRVSEAASCFEEQVRHAVERGDYQLALQCGGSLALAKAAQADIPAAHTALAACIELAAPADFRSSVLDQGPAMHGLLKSLFGAAVASSLSPAAKAFLGTLVATSADGAKSDTPASDVVLSARERDILMLLAEEKSNKEISRMLNIAPETVKSHIKHIFGKLDVNRRAHAVRRAQSLLLLPA